MLPTVFLRPVCRALRKLSAEFSQEQGRSVDLLMPFRRAFMPALLTLADSVVKTRRGRDWDASAQPDRRRC